MPSTGRPPYWPQFAVEAGFITTTPVQAGGTFILDDAIFGKLDTDTLGASIIWSDITQWVRSATISRPASRQQGPLYDFQVGTLTMVLKNADGRFDHDNLGGPYVAAGVSEIIPMAPLRVSATWNGVTYRLFTGFADAWTDSGQNYAGNYAQLTVTASDGQKILNAINLPALISPVGAGELTGARISRILDSAGWFTGTDLRTIAAGSSTVQATSYGDSAWSLMKLASDSEIGELYVNGAGSVVFRSRQQILSDTRSNTVQLVLGDLPESIQSYGEEEPFTTAPPVLDDTTLANDIQATRVGGSLQQVQDAASIQKYLFPRSYQRTDLILQNDPDVLNWAQWVLYVSKGADNRLDFVTLTPRRDPDDLWPHALGREMGDRIQLYRRPPGVYGSIAENCFIRGIEHNVDWSAQTFTTTWVLQDAAKYGSFLTLDNSILGKLNSNALAY